MRLGTVVITFYFLVDGGSMTKSLVLSICLLAMFASVHSVAKPAASIKLYVFNCGVLKTDDVSPFGISNDETPVRELIVPCYVVEHNGDRLLWDGGLPSSVADKEGWHVVDGTTMRLDRTFREQVEEMGLTMSSFKYTAFSHMHFDHTGIANEIEDTTLIIQKKEAEFAFVEEPKLAFADVSLYRRMFDAKKIIIDGDFDVFGDGSVKIVSAPGHTPGHQLLYINLPNTGPLMLSGDLYHFRLSRTDRRVPSFNYDKKSTLLSMTRIEAFVKSMNAEFWIEHDMALFKTLKTAPLFYD